MFAWRIIGLHTNRGSWISTTLELATDVFLRKDLPFQSRTWRTKRKENTQIRRSGAAVEIALGHTNAVTGGVVNLPITYSGPAATAFQFDINRLVVMLISIASPDASKPIGRLWLPQF